MARIVSGAAAVNDSEDRYLALLQTRVHETDIRDLCVDSHWRGFGLGNFVFPCK
jgi:hypothetical protein